VTEFGKELAAITTPIPGLLVFELPVHGDSRGWFKENWQREKMLAVGLPDFGPVQNNISFNNDIGTTRGIHAEPWDKWVSVASGRVFGAWVDLREGPTFGTSFTADIDPSRAVFVPRGVANSYQTLEPDTAYTYLVNDHWSPDAEYSFLNLADETVAIPWPIALDRSEISPKDAAHPRLDGVKPLPPRKTLILGANGQLGTAFRKILSGSPAVDFASRADVDLTDPDLRTLLPWHDYATIINAAAYTAVDEAESPQGRRKAWDANVTGVAALSRIAAEHRITLVHVSTDYVFDGSLDREYREDDPPCPLGVYGQTKAAGEAVVGSVPRHYVVRTSWVIGAGRNFVTTMAALAARGVDPTVVDDQTGRLTFADELARGILHLIGSAAPFGIYNITGGGAPMTWADVARRVFELTGHDPARVTGVSTEDYFGSRQEPTAPRPRNSVQDLAKIEATGFVPRDGREALEHFLAN
jgi:dTDP-4-dehydrorhamnose reductase/dTDP-4-dehydrorhamnose 3,5-epimerase